MTDLTAATVASAAKETTVPDYDRGKLEPGIVHIGLGNFHRAHQAFYLDLLLSEDPEALRYGIVGVNLLPQDETLARAMAEQDRLYTLLQRHPDGATEVRVIGSVVDNLWAPDDPEAVLRTLADPRIKVVSMTITEGGYCQDPVTGEVDLATPGLQADLASPHAPTTAFGYLAEALRRRRDAGVAPFTVMSCDNVIGNGDLTREVVLAFTGEQDPALRAWIEEHVAFPNSMVDRITPRTTPDDVADAQTRTGLADACPVPCEGFIQWVLEDKFTAGRPAYEKVGVQLVDDVRPYELMKLRLVNAGHQAIAYAGSLLGHEFVWQACADDTVRRLLEYYLRHEGSAVVDDLPGVDVEEYCATVVDRFANPQILDTLARLRTPSSTMLSTFVMPAGRQLVEAGKDVTAVAAILACWAKVLEGHDDAGRPLELVDDRAEDLLARVADRDDPLALVRGNTLFAGLDGVPAFTEPYTRTLLAIREHGTRRALDDLFATA